MVVFLLNQYELLRARFDMDRDEEGQTLAEYALILALIAIVVIAIVALLGTEIGNIFSEITSGLTDR